jgi:signal peptidase I
MSATFALVMFILVVVTGLVWLADVLYRRVYRRDKSEAKQNGGWRWFADTCRGFFPLILAVLVIRSFVVEPFHIPSGSLTPTILIGDFVVTEKYAYGLRLPVIHDKVLDIGEPRRGDIFVFRWPVNPKIDFIKRVIGVPGDRITYTCDNQLIVNGKQVKREYVGKWKGRGGDRKFVGWQEWREYLPRKDGTIVKHNILINPSRPSRCGRTWVVPPHEYFAMGDNRDDSEDSRYWGSVPERDLVGQARVVFFNFQGWGRSPLWGRIGTLLN